MKRLRTAAAFLLTIFSGFFVPRASADFSLILGDYYSSNYFSRTITQYNSSGSVVGSLTLSSGLADEVRGLAFGSDNLLYATVVRGSGFAVVALDNSGTVQQTYLGSAFLGGDISAGKIALDDQYIYVAGGQQLTRFALGDPNSGTSIYSNNAVIDSKPLPNGDLFVAFSTGIDEITRNGIFVRTIPLVGDDNFYNDLRGIEYDVLTNTLFATELGHTGFSFQIMKIDAATGILENNVSFTYADDLFLDISGRLVVGSRTETPRFYSEDLALVGTFGDGQQMFLTQLIPEPATISYILLTATAALLWLLGRGGRRSRRAGRAGS
jgi:hypothetical protein